LNRRCKRTQFSAHSLPNQIYWALYLRRFLNERPQRNPVGSVFSFFASTTLNELKIIWQTNV
jgi:hypothetical protein